MGGKNRIMKLAIIGGRDFTDFNKAEQVFWEYYCFYDDETGKPYAHIDEIISGGAKGADLIAKRLATKYKVKYTEFPADWDKYGKFAGFKRNIQIVDSSDMVLAFWDGTSKGTAHSLSLAKQAKKNTIIVYY